MTSRYGALYIISAPSGCGKTSLVNGLLKSLPKLAVSVSYTTRPPRPGEQDGIDYCFIDEAGFQHLIAGGGLLEYARVFNYYYGTSLPWVEERLAAGWDVILEIDWQGARQIREKIAEAIGVFILPPSWEALEQRLRLRAQDGEATIERRMRAAKAEMSHYAEYEYLVVNDCFDQALTSLASILRAGRLRRDAQQRTLNSLLKTLLQ